MDPRRTSLSSFTPIVRFDDFELLPLSSSVADDRADRGDRENVDDHLVSRSRSGARKRMRQRYSPVERQSTEQSHEAGASNRDELEAEYGMDSRSDMNGQHAGDPLGEIGADPTPDTPLYHNTMLPIDCPPGYPRLDIRPIVLKTPMLIFLLVFYLCGLAGVIALYLCSNKSLQYHSDNPNTYFIVHYIPSIVGTATQMTYRAMFETLARITPYMSLANPTERCVCTSNGSRTIGASYFTAYHHPFQCLRTRQWLRFGMWCGMIVSSFTVGVKSGVLGAVKVDKGWTITVRPFYIGMILPMYAIFAGNTLRLIIHFWMNPTTGLKWDPTTIADQLALFHHSNVLCDFSSVETNPDKSCFELLREKNYRLGYWERGIERGIWYGIGRVCVGGELEQPAHSNPGLEPRDAHLSETQIDRTGNSVEPSSQEREHSLLQQELSHQQEEPPHRQQEPLQQEQDLPNQDHKTTTREGCPSHQEASNGETDLLGGCLQPGSDLHRPFCQCYMPYHFRGYPYRRNSPYERPFLYFWFTMVLLGFSLSIKTIVHGHVNHKFSIANSWWRPFSKNSTSIEQLNANVTAPADDVFADIGHFAFDPAHDLGLYLFVYRTIPTILSSFFAIGFMNAVDAGHRFSQPFANMYRKSGTASNTILLDHLWDLPLLVTIDALKKSHWKVAYFPFLDLCSSAVPILMGGLFTITNRGARIEFQIARTTFWILFGFFCTYLISLPVAFPTQNRRLPRFHNSLGDLLSFCYASRLIGHPALNITDPRMNKAYMNSWLEFDESRYRFGTFNGADGQRHLGFDMAKMTHEDGRGRGEVNHVFDVRFPEKQRNSLPMGRLKRRKWSRKTKQEQAGDAV